jgi:hypothetical protein
MSALTKKQPDKYTNQVPVLKIKRYNRTNILIMQPKWYFINIFYKLFNLIIIWISPKTLAIAREGDDF